jgi:hypothetical protein
MIRWSTSQRAGDDQMMHSASDDQLLQVQETKSDQQEQAIEAKRCSAGA